MSNAPRGRRSGGRAARQAARSEAATETRAFLTRTMTPVEVVSTEGLETIEHNADTILAEMGIDFRDYPSALTLLADAGADGIEDVIASLYLYWVEGVEVPSDDELMGTDG